MNKKYVYLLILAILAVIGGAIYIYTNYNLNENQNAENYNSTRTSYENETPNQNRQTNEVNETSKTNETNNVNQSIVPENTDENKSTQTKETEIASFTTKIYSKDKDRQNNVTLACSALNDTTVKNGSTFSFSNTVGKATTKKGYKKADVFKNGEVIEALGGGLCQVSTTLYNAVLKVSDIKVTERHAHSNKVPYIKSGKDAAVSYGTYDFKFVNNTGNTIKIKASNTTNNITIKIIKIE